MFTSPVVGGILLPLVLLLSRRRYYFCNLFVSLDENFLSRRVKMTALALSYSTWRPAEAIQGQSTTFEGFSGYILDIGSLNFFIKIIFLNVGLPYSQGKNMIK